MIYSVPQYIDVEDKVAGPLTVKQLGWMIILFVLLATMFTMIENRVVFVILAIPIVLFFVALAFYRPYGQPLIGFVIAGFRYFFNQKIYVWRRVPKNAAVKDKEKEKESEMERRALSQEEERRETLKNLKHLAKILDEGKKGGSQNIAQPPKTPGFEK